MNDFPGLSVESAHAKRLETQDCPPSQLQSLLALLLPQKSKKPLKKLTAAHATATATTHFLISLKTKMVDSENSIVCLRFTELKATRCRTATSPDEKSICKRPALLHVVITPDFFNHIGLRFQVSTARLSQFIPPFHA